MQPLRANSSQAPNCIDLLSNERLALLLCSTNPAKLPGILPSEKQAIDQRRHGEGDAIRNDLVRFCSGGMFEKCLLDSNEVSVLSHSRPVIVAPPDKVADKLIGQA